MYYFHTHFYHRFVPEDKKKKKGKKLKTDDELIEEISFVREDQRSPEEIINDENQTDPPYRADYSVTDYEDEDSDSDVPPELPRQTKSGRLTQKPKLFVPEDKKKKKGKKLKTDDELIEEISFVREDQRQLAPTN